MRKEFTDEQLAPVVEAYREHGSQDKAALALGTTRDVVRTRLKHAAERGMLLDSPPAMPGYRISQVTTNPAGGQTIQQRPEHGEKFEIPEGLRLKGVTALVDAEGRVMHKHVLAREGRGYEPSQLVEIFRNAFAEFDGRAAPIEPPLFVEEDFANLIPCNDWHLNMLAWKRQTGRSWDLKIAEPAIGNAVETVIARSRKASVAYVLGGGDLMHNDDNTNRTAKSGNVLDCDGRHQKGIEVAQRLMVRTIDAALKHNKRVIVRNLEGNHDETSAVAVGQFLAAWYRNEPRITVDLDASLYWYQKFGNVMIAATHGHAAKPTDMPGIMAHRRPEMWGGTKFRFAHTFHVHHRSKMTEKEHNGVICETHQAPIPPDGWHYGEGYCSGQSVQVITYHRKYGEWTREREPVMDAATCHQIEKVAA